MKRSIVFLILTLNIQLLNAQSEAEQRAMWICNIAYGTSWNNESEIDTFEIGVFSSNEAYQALSKLSVERTIKGKPFNVFLYQDHKKIPDHHMIFVSRKENAYLALIYKKYKAKNVLIISDRSHQPEYSVINFNKVNNLKKFDLNSEFGNIQGLEFTENIKNFGGSRELLQEAYRSNNEELKRANEKILELQIESAEKDIHIGELENEISKLKQRIQHLEEAE